jgi:hypothetical protein
VFVVETAIGGNPIAYRVPSASKAAGQFVVSASVINSNTIDWMLVR